MYFDGSCTWEGVRRTGCGFVIYEVGADGARFFARGHCIIEENRGKEHLNSSNAAEYKGLWMALNHLKEKGLTDAKVVVYGDSKLVINQQFAAWAIRGGVYVEWARKVETLISEFSDIDGVWVPREMNHRADNMARRGLKRQFSWIQEREEYEKVLAKTKNTPLGVPSEVSARLR